MCKLKMLHQDVEREFNRLHKFIDEDKDDNNIAYYQLKLLEPIYMSLTEIIKETNKEVLND